MYLEEGRVVEIGEPQRVVDLYRGEVLGEELEEDRSGQARWGDGAARITDVWIENGNGEPTTRSRQGDRLAIGMEVAFKRDMDEPIFGVTLRDENGVPVFDSNTLWRQIPTGSFRAGDVQRVRWTIDNCFRAGSYFIEGAVAHPSGEQFAEVRERAAKVTVFGDLMTHGFVILPDEFEMDPR
jgi:lipopolysaccharide transport system ATP-binding protein